ncbi:MAG: hypothetical protein L0212_11555 [Acidobacteria bacterium]|nr:hypothetical protein [Acidobacteriota bacterium]
MRRCSPLLVLTLLLCAPALLAKDKPDPRLREVSTIFVKGNNQAAEKIRELLRKGKTCFQLATKAEDADAVLEVDADAAADPGSLGSFGRREWIVSGTLTLKSGDLVWSKSRRFGDAPFMSGAKSGGDVLLHDLAKDADCKNRKKN